VAHARHLTRHGRRRPRWTWLVFLALLVVPVAEIALIVAVGKVIGGWQTIALLLFESALGAYLVKREGRRSWRALKEALSTGRMPGRELADAALVLIGGTLLLTPGFLTDIVGFFFILPFTRPVTRRWLQRVVERQLVRGRQRLLGMRAQLAAGVFRGVREQEFGVEAWGGAVAQDDCGAEKSLLDGRAAMIRHCLRSGRGKVHWVYD